MAHRLLTILGYRQLLGVTSTEKPSRQYTDTEYCLRCVSKGGIESVKASSKQAYARLQRCKKKERISIHVYMNRAGAVLLSTERTGRDREVKRTLAVYVSHFLVCCLFIVSLSVALYSA